MTLTFYSNLPDNVHKNFQLVKGKVNGRFGPGALSQTVQNQINVVQQNPDEELEEYAGYCHHLARG